MAQAERPSDGGRVLWVSVRKGDATDVPNGVYVLQSVATEVGGTTATSPGITVTVAN
jgi:hypothetical protein